MQRCRGCDADAYDRYCPACLTKYMFHPSKDVRAAFWHDKIEQAKKDALSARERFDFERCRHICNWIELMHPELGQRVRALYLTQ